MIIVEGYDTYLLEDYLVLRLKGEVPLKHNFLNNTDRLLTLHEYRIYLYEQRKKNETNIQ